jgi:hypothetical protein
VRGRALLGAAAAALALTSCGSSEVVGTVSEVEGRLCVVRVYLQTGQPANSECVLATPDQLAGVSVGDCVRATFGDVEPGRVPTAAGVERLPARECAPD